MPLEDEEDQRRLLAAQGFLELGMPLEANEELERIDPQVRHFPEVLAVRVEIYQTLERWELMQVVAKKLTESDPKNPRWALKFAYAVRRADSLESARTVLLDAVERFPTVAAIHYNLACYECQLRHLESAKARLRSAFELDAKLRLQALEDSDFEPLWLSL